jgi:hypothetical protein
VVSVTDPYGRILDFLDRIIIIIILCNLEHLAHMISFSNNISCVIFLDFKILCLIQYVTSSLCSVYILIAVHLLP